MKSSPWFNRQGFSIFHTLLTTMEFQLPSNLKSTLIPYDPALKKLTVKTNSTRTSAKPRYSLGNVQNLIPTDIVSSELQQEAVDRINSVPVEQRVNLFSRELDDGKMQVYAVIYHFEGMWIASWLPPAGEDYLYGVSFAFRNVVNKDKIRNFNYTVGHSFPKGIDDPLIDYNYVKFGRSEYRTFSINIDKDIIASGVRRLVFRHPSLSSWKAKSKVIWKALSSFETQVLSQIPRWEDSPDLFDRYILNNKTLPTILARDSHIVSTSWFDKWIKEGVLPTDNILTADHAIRLLTRGKPDDYPDAVRVLSTPFFRRWVQEQCDAVNSRFTDPAVDTRREVAQPWHVLEHVFCWIKFIESMWDSIPIDYYQTHLPYLLHLRSPWSIGATPELTHWLNKHMPIASFFSIIKKKGTEATINAQNNNSRWFDNTSGLYLESFYELQDTFSMIKTILKAGVDLQPPDRWRITEFHDAMQAESWKISNPNIDLPQDLFPVPIKVEVGDQRWSFFQPKDTHQLAAWGQAVRNCVGSASNYAEGVKKKRHFIVLCMIDNKPSFTIQLNVNNGLMSVDQIAGLSNSRLDEQQKQSYTTAFREALNRREDALTSQP